MNLSKAAHRRAEWYLQEHARPLELALYRHRFAHQRPDDALRELARFQNADGGFGRGLEPDLRIERSSVLATTVALQQLARLSVGADEPLVQGALGYLGATYDPELDAWPIIPAHDNSTAQAPWWGYSDELAATWNGFLANPRAEILGYFHTWPTLAPPGLRESLTPRVIAHLAEAPETLEMHDLMCYARLANAPGVPPETRAALIAHLEPHVERAVQRDLAAWDAYGLQPLDVVAEPSSAFAQRLREALDTNLDYVTSHQGDDGAWEPAWSWGDVWPEAWAQARNDWKGVLTLRNLGLLEAFGRIEA